MTLKNHTWTQYELYLIGERDVADNKHNLGGHRSYFKKVKNHFEDVEFSNVTIREWVFIMRRDNVSPSTINKVIQTIKNINRCFELGINITVGRLKELAYEFEVLSEDEIIAIAEVGLDYQKAQDFLNLRNQIIYKLAGLNGGCRWREMALLTWDDFKETPEPHIIFRHTKNGEHRKVFLSDHLYQLFKQLPQDKDYIFTAYRGNKPLNNQEINLDIRKRARLIGIAENRLDKIGFYTFRHSFATNRIDNENKTYSDIEVAETMGHKDLRNLQRYKQKSVKTTKKVILSSAKLSDEKPVTHIVEDIRRYIRNITANDRRFNPLACEESLLVEKLLKGGGENERKTARVS